MVKKSYKPQIKNKASVDKTETSKNPGKIFPMC